MAKMTKAGTNPFGGHQAPAFGKKAAVKGKNGDPEGAKDPGGPHDKEGPGDTNYGGKKAANKAENLKLGLHAGHAKTTGGKGDANIIAKIEARQGPVGKGHHNAKRTAALQAWLDKKQGQSKTPAKKTHSASKSAKSAALHKKLAEHGKKK